MQRVIAIGDMHGCLEALEALLQAIAPQPDDLVVTLGDYIDRGPDSCGVVERLRLLASQCQLVPLLGNHEEMMLSTLDGRAPRGWWLSHGGEATQKSYDRQAEGPRLLQEHREWLATCREYHETDSWFFTHANYVASEPLISQPAEALRWQSLAEHFPGRHMSGKRAVVGHTAQRSGEVLWTQQLVCIDTHCYAGGWLTGLEVTSGRLWQVSRGGRLRERQAAVPPPGER